MIFTLFLFSKNMNSSMAALLIFLMLKFVHLMSPNHCPSSELTIHFTSNIEM